MSDRARNDRAIIPRKSVSARRGDDAKPVFPGLLDATSTPLWELSQRRRGRSVAMWPALACLLVGFPALMAWLVVTGPLASVPIWFILAGGAVWCAVTIRKAITYWRNPS